VSVTVPPDTETWVDAVTYGYVGERTDPFPDTLYVPGVQADLTPTIDVGGVTPATGAEAGNEPVTITGTLLFRALVKFGTEQASSVVVAQDGTSLTCTTPTGVAGAVDVVVITPGGEATATGGFTYA
jgi:hypothetical protein